MDYWIYYTLLCDLPTERNIAAHNLCKCWNTILNVTFAITIDTSPGLSVSRVVIFHEQTLHDSFTLRWVRFYKLFVLMSSNRCNTVSKIRRCSGLTERKCKSKENLRVIPPSMKLYASRDAFIIRKRYSIRTVQKHRRI